MGGYWATQMAPLSVGSKGAKKAEMKVFCWVGHLDETTAESSVSHWAVRTASHSAVTKARLTAEWTASAMAGLWAASKDSPMADWLAAWWAAKWAG